MKGWTTVKHCMSKLHLLVVAAFLLPTLVTLGLGSTRVWSAENDASLKAGLCKIDITPEEPVKMSGYGARKELSTGVHDPLAARITALESGGKRLVLVSADLIGFYGTYESIRDAICQRSNLQVSELFLCGTHTHSAPTPTLSEDAHPNNVQYTRNLQVKLCDAVDRAIQDIGPVQIGTGRGHSPVGVNRREKQPDGSIHLGRNPYGPADKEVLVMRLARPDGTPVAALFDYATHATSLGSKNLLISGDVLGLAAQFVEKILSPEVIAPAFAGASGDIDPWYRVLPSFETQNGWIPEPELMGMMLGQEVVHVFRKIKTAPSTAEIKTDFATLELPAKKREGRDSDPAAATRTLNVSVARIGDVAVLGMGCELLTEVGMAIKAASPFEHTFLITHCNGSAGYLPPQHLYEEGGYEITTSGFAPEAAELAVHQVVQMLQQLK
jgi:hypothetical protein